MLRFSIGTKLIITFLALAIIPMSAIAYYNLTQSRDEVVQLAKENLIELSRSTTYPIEQLIAENQHTSATLAGDQLVAKFLAASEKERQALTSKVYKTLRNYADTHPEHDSPGLLDVNGIVVASLDDILVGKDRSFRDYFKASIQGRPYISDILVGRTTKRPGVFLTNPVISEEGEIVGVNLIWLKADAIWNIIDNVSVGKEGIAYLVDQDGVIIAHPDRDLLYHSLGELTPEAVSTISSTIRFGTVKDTKTPVIPKTLGMDQLSDQLTKARGSGSYRYFSPLDNRYHVAGYTPLKTKPWTVVVDLPEARFLAPLERMRTVAWISVGLVAVITFIISILLVRGIVRPIRRLTDVAAAVEHNQPFEPSDIEDLTMGHDEVAHLGRVFGGMVLSLQNELKERKRAEEALRDSEEKYRSMMESMKAAVFICSPDFRVEYMNPAMIKRMGRDATGEVCHKAIHDLDERCPECVHDKIQQGESAETAIFSPKDNRYYSVSHSPIFHQDGSISKMTIYRDITGKKRAEEERIRLATAIEQASESIIISDRPGTIQYVNPAFEQLSGFNREEIIGQNFRILKSNKHDEAFYREMYDIISHGHTWAGRIINTMKDGTLSEFETRISPVKDSSGEIISFVSVNRDVTQEKALEAQLQHAQRMDAIGTLAGGIAHDFNNILSSVIGFTELALDDAEKGTLQYENLQEVLVAGSRAKDLVHQILTFSRQSDQEQKPVNVQLIAKEALKLLRASIPSTIEIKQNIQSEALVMGDSTQIHQVFMNLCTNAAHAMEDKGGVLTVDLVDIKLDSEFISDYPDLKPGTYINLTVTDTGHGMVPDVLDKIFDPFFTTKDKGKGTGMGLSVVHGIVHSHGGSIYVYSEPGKGSTFRIFLPVFKRRLESEERIEGPIPTGTERILFVDDEPGIVNIGKQTLKSLGYNVVTRTSSIEALEFFKTQPDRVDIVITDLTMPNMTGEELAQELMQIRPDIPIILCTGFSVRMDEKKAMNMGIRAFVSKPILKREIAETIRKVIDSS